MVRQLLAEIDALRRVSELKSGRMLKMRDRIIELRKNLADSEAKAHERLRKLNVAQPEVSMNASAWRYKNPDGTYATFRPGPIQPLTDADRDEVGIKPSAGSDADREIERLRTALQIAELQRDYYDGLSIVRGRDLRIINMEKDLEATLSDKRAAETALEVARETIAKLTGDLHEARSSTKKRGRK